MNTLEKADQIKIGVIDVEKSVKEILTATDSAIDATAFSGDARTQKYHSELKRMRQLLRNVTHVAGNAEQTYKAKTFEYENKFIEQGRELERFKNIAEYYRTHWLVKLFNKLGLIKC